MSKARELSDLLKGVDVDGTVAAGSVTADAISLNPTTGYANIEMGGPDGSYIDLKSPFSDDYDGRIITSGTGLIITSGSGSGSVDLQHQGATKLHTTATGVYVIGTATTTLGFQFGNSYLYEGATDQVNMRIGTDGPYLEFVDAGSGVAEVGNASGPLALTASGTERLRIESDGGLKHLSKPAYFARVWVNFKGTGTVSIRESNNVSSITDLGTGDYRVNFYTAMTDANYSIHFGGSPQNGRFLINWAGTINNGSNAVVNSTSNCRIAMIDGGSGSRSDSTNNYVSIFR